MTGVRLPLGAVPYTQVAFHIVSTIKIISIVVMINIHIIMTIPNMI